MKLLAIETSTPQCSVALAVDDVVYSLVSAERNTHTKVCLTMIDELLGQANIHLNEVDYFVTSKGPGSFTGLRIGISLMQGLALALDKKIIPLSSLQTLAYAAKPTSKNILALLDARKSEVYGGYFNDKLELLFPEFVLPVANLPNIDLANSLLVGSALTEYSAQLKQRFGNQLHYLELPYPDAPNLLALALQNMAQAVSACEFIPSYIRDNVTG